ncbi:mothers against decapentaplegic homolog 7 isoform X5 [Canis aureus]
MFRTKRSALVRRLWRSRAPGGEDEEEGAGGGGGELRGEGATDGRAHGAGGGGGGGGGGGAGRAGCCLGKAARGAKGHHHPHPAAAGAGGAGGAEADLKALTHSVLKKLKERQLELLLQAVESRGGTRTACLLLPGRLDCRLGPGAPAGSQPAQPPSAYSLPLLLCKVFRWPDLRHSSEVKRLCCCESYGKINPELVCCNPHHLSRLCELESPPPPYSRYPMDFLKPTADCPDAVPSSAETGGTNFLAPGGLSGTVTNQSSRPAGSAKSIPNFFWSLGIGHTGEWLLPRTAQLGQQESAGAKGAEQDRLRHPADAGGGRRVGIQPQQLPHLHQVGHTGQPGLQDAVGAQSVPRFLHQGF